MPASDRPDDAGHENGFSAAVQCLARIIEINAFQGRCKMIRITFPTDLSVGYQIEAGPFLVLDSQAGCIILGLTQVFLIDPPEFPRPGAGREALR